jgi:hypothetical protein
MWRATTPPDHGLERAEEAEYEHSYSDPRFCSAILRLLRWKASMATIMVGGVEITVPTAELGEALRQLSPWLSAKPAAVAAPVKDDEPAAQRRRIVVAPAQQTLENPESAEGESQPEGNDPSSALNRALRLLALIRDHRQSGGARPAEVMKVLGAAHPKGIGSRMQAVNSVIRATGLKPEDVYRNDRDPMTGTRMWTGGRKLDEAAAMLNKQKSGTP